MESKLHRGLTVSLVSKESILNGELVAQRLNCISSSFQGDYTQ